MSKLRERMIDDMNLAGLSSRTQEEYIRAVSQRAQYFTMSPNRITENQLRQYLIYLYKEKSIARIKFQVKYHGIKSFFYRALGRNWGRRSDFR